VQYRREIRICRLIYVPLARGMVDNLLLDIAKWPDSLELFGFLDQAELPLFKALSLLPDLKFRKNALS
jgi:hypothetical protein